MKRTSLFAALVLATGMSLGSIAAAERPAQTNLVDNGLNLNGIVINGFALNGWHLNGIVFNGLNINGRRLNGIALNGRYFNGLKWNGATPRAAATNPFLGLDQAPLGQ